MFNPNDIKKDFPILSRQINGHRLVYLDNAATTQKPEQVIAAEADFYREHNANIHRGIHALAEEATALYETAREKVRQFINARSTEEIIFVRNATEGLNLIAQTWGRQNINPGDEIILTEMEHHANLLPWQRLAKEKGARLRFIELTEDGRLKTEEVDSVVGNRTKLVALTHASNVLGSINDIARITVAAHNAGAVAVLDSAQSVPHLPLDVQKLDVDFMVFSGHKMLGPTGIGVLYGKKDLLEKMDPFLVGGEMIREVSYESATWHDLPWRFEAGTPNIAGAIGLGAAIDYLNNLGIYNVRQHEMTITKLAMEKLSGIDGVTVYGPENVEDRGGVVSFNIDGVHAHDVATILDEQGVAIRSGHHCAQPLIKKLGLSAAARASFYIYNDEADVDALIDGIKRVQKVFK